MAKGAYIGVKNTYKILDYIESSGTQYIDTGFKPNQNTRVVVDIELASQTYPKAVFGARNSSSVAFILWAFNDSGFRDDYGANSYTFSQTPTGRFLIDKNKNVTNINGAENTASSATFQVNYPLTLFAQTEPSGADARMVEGKLYSCQIYDNGTLVRDYVPCKNDSNNYGLYDKVTGVFYGNKGTGSFTAGSETGETIVSERVARKIKKGYIGVNGVARKMKTGYVGVNGVARQFFAGFDPVFANNTWEQIIKACQANAVPDTWVVGDQLAMTINGTDYLIDIIGKNHDNYSDGSGTAPLTFQMHECYTSTRKMYSSKANNSVGWTGCDMRTTHLPAILALMPTEVQSAIKEVNKLTSAGNKSSTIKTTADKLFLLSEIEIFGKATHSFAGEGSQYAYYAAGNSKIKPAVGTSSPKYGWWERSPAKSNNTNFCEVDINGSSTTWSSIGNEYVSCAFCF